MIRKGDFHDQILGILLLFSCLYMILNGYECFQLENRCVIMINVEKCYHEFWDDLNIFIL